MTKNPLLYGVVGAFIGGALVWIAASNPANNNLTGITRMMGIRQGVNESSIANGLDKHFIEQMIPHHEGAIEMAKLAQERSKRPEILNLAGSIIKSQSQEITQMQTWYKSWSGVDVPVNTNVSLGMGRGIMHGGMMGGKTSDITSLKNTTDFDEAFLQEMIPHHQMAVMMAQMLLAGTDRLEMKQLSQNIIAAQEKEIEQMRSWLE